MSLGPLGVAAGGMPGPHQGLSEEQFRGWPRVLWGFVAEGGKPLLPLRRLGSWSRRWGCCRARSCGLGSPAASRAGSGFLPVDSCDSTFHRFAAALQDPGINLSGKCCKNKKVAPLPTLFQKGFKWKKVFSIFNKHLQYY